MILGLRTDKPESELYLHDTEALVADYSWPAHRNLSKELLTKIDDLLSANGVHKDQLSGVVVFKGPGSFTGLRIGISVANALADALAIPVIAKGGEAWLDDATNALADGQNDGIALPEYGGDANITKPRK